MLFGTEEGKRHRKWSSAVRKVDCLINTLKATELCGVVQTRASETQVLTVSVF